MPEVFQLAHEDGMDGRVRVIACGAGDSQLQEIYSTLDDCIQSGHWLILHNVHLISTWSKPVVDLIKVARVISQIHSTRPEGAEIPLDPGLQSPTI